jgi:hypothetical protein
MQCVIEELTGFDFLGCWLTPTARLRDASDVVLATLSL